MESFEILENYTKVPNEVFLIVKFMKPSSYIVLIHIVRKTVGFNKKSDGISISQFVEATGLSKRQIINSIAELKELKVINITRQTHKNGGKSYNRYKLNLKGITTLVQNLHKGGADNAQGVVQNLHKGSADNAHTKDNRQNTIEQKKRESSFFVLTDELIEKYTSSYVQSLISSSPNLKNAKAYEIALKKKISSKNKTQLEDFDKWLLELTATNLTARYKEHEIIFDEKLFKIVEIITYLKFNGVFDGNQFLVKLTNLSDGSYSYIKITETQSVINLIKEKEIKKVS